MRVKRDGRDVKVEVRADGQGLVSHAGAALIAETADRLGLISALDRALGGLFERTPTHSPGRVVCDLAVMLADGGDALCDLGAVREQAPLFGPVASDATAYRLIERIAADAGALARIRAARAEARARAWRRGTRPRLVVIDLDATLLTAHSDKEGAAGNYKGGYGFHPCSPIWTVPRRRSLAGCGRATRAPTRPPTRSPCSTPRWPSCPRASRRASRSSVRADSAGATHELTDFCRDGNLRFSVGFELTEPIREAILAIGEDTWICRRLTQDGVPRDDGAWVAEITAQLDLSSWPAGSRMLMRREVPHPGAQMGFTDHDGHRFQAVLTDQRDEDIAYLEARHRGHARVEGRIKAGKDTGMAKLPFRDFAMNAVWLELSLIAQDLLAWTKTLALDGELARCDPKRLRYRLLHTAGRLTFHARRAILHLDRDWPWAAELAAAFARLQALPQPTR